MYCYTVTSILTACTCRWLATLWIHKAIQADVSISLDFHSRLEQPPIVKFYARESTPESSFSTIYIYISPQISQVGSEAILAHTIALEQKHFLSCLWYGCVHGVKSLHHLWQTCVSWDQGNAGDFIIAIYPLQIRHWMHKGLEIEQCSLAICIFRNSEDTDS